MSSEQSSDFIYDTFIEWSNKSENIDFKTNKRCIGAGELKVSKELDINKKVGGQNSTVDLYHSVLGEISVKNMTKDDCILGADGCENMRIIFETTAILLYLWCKKYKSKCKLANKYYNDINKSYSKIKKIKNKTIIEGIHRFELSASNLSKLNELLNELKEDKKNLENKYDSLKSEYIDDIVNNLKDKSLKELLDECVRKEAIDKTLIIVHETKGYLIVKDISKLSCPRITRGAPRIKYDF